MELCKKWLEKSRDELIYVEMPKYDLTFYMRKLSARATVEMEALGEGATELDKVLIALVDCCLDKKGDPLFVDEDKDLLKQQSSDFITELWSKIIENSKHTETVDEQAKNS